MIQKIIQNELNRLGLLARETKKIQEISPTGRKIRSLKIKNVEPIPMDIDLVRKNIDNKSDKSLAIVNGQIKDKSFPIVCDSGSNISIIPIECCNELEMEIDTQKNYNLSGVATEKKSVGIVHDISITLAPDCIITEDFVVIEGHPHRELILSRTCLKRYNYDLLESRKHMAITCDSKNRSGGTDEKNYFIPLVSRME